MQIDTLLTRNVAHADLCRQNIENNYVKALLLMKDKPLYSGKVCEWRETKPPRRGKRGCRGKLRGETLKITADKDQPTCKVSSWNPTRNNITAEEHQPTQMVGSWNPRGERFEIRVLKYKVQRTTAYAATTLTLSTAFHLKPRCHANMVTLDTPTCSTCSETFPGSLSPKA